VTPVGGQAVLEGVMMRTPRYWAVSVRRPDGRISNIARASSSAASRHRLLRLPVIRGVVVLGDSMAIGMRALSVSARYAVTDEDSEQPDEMSTISIVVSVVLAIGFAIAVFKVGPSLLTKWLGFHHTVTFVLVEGAIRVAALVGYLAVLRLIPDLRRVFQYHAAEHMAINALEAGDTLEPERVAAYSRIHLRCGTAFLLWVMVVAIVVFLFVTPSSWIGLVVSRIAMLPLIAGVAYELIRLAARFGANPIVRGLLAPGLWLQRLTTREPTLAQIEVSIDALKSVLRLESERGGVALAEVMA
jgi:uncharacterized protein YqhQ